MRRFRSGGRWPLAIAVGLLALAAPAARTEDEPQKHPDVHPWRIKRFRGDYFYGNNNRPHTFERAGYPNEVSKLAHPSETPNYGGYYVGGGCTFRGDAPGPADGTYGWDYVSLCRFDYRVMLRWCCRYKGGYGKYKIDGPPVPDVGPYVEQIREGPELRRHREYHEEHH
ncbi:MAG: hypothetical protein HYS12_08725 [Planctomycetes bacterium]|nr:hypothetical protein [Planctomycetota bacterium]